MKSTAAQLHLRDTPAKRVTLQPSQPLTIGQAGNNRLALTSLEGVSPHHAVVRFNSSHGWMVCDWQSSDGTYLEGERVRSCRPLSDGDEIRLGLRGPVLVFSLVPPKAPLHTTPKGSSNAASGGSGVRTESPRRTYPPCSIDIDGTMVPLAHIQSAVVLSEPLYPHIFSWWVLTSVAGLLLLPFQLVFWPLELAALAAWILLGSRKCHTLLVVQHDGRAQRRQFANRVTALAHRNGIRKAISQSLQKP